MNKQKLVIKLGGSCLQQESDFKHAALLIKRLSSSYNVCVTVSAQSGMTDELLQSAQSLTESQYCCPRELDALVSMGENMSAAKMALALRTLGLKGKSLNAFQLELVSHGEHGQGVPDALLSKSRIKLLMKNDYIPVISGFQALNDAGDIVTLGRNTSDLSAVFLAHEVNADLVFLYKDVGGIYEKQKDSTRYFDKLTLAEALDIAEGGAAVLNEQALEYLQQHFIPTHVKGFRQTLFPGTELIQTGHSKFYPEIESKELHACK